MIIYSNRPVYLLTLLSVLIITQTVGGYERSFITVPHSTSLRPRKDLEFSLSHLFEGTVNDEPLKNIFGFKKGALVDLRLRMTAVKSATFIAGVLFRESEYILGADYSFNLPESLPYIIPSVQYITFAADPFELSGNEQRKHLFISSLTVQKSFFTKKLDIGMHGTYNSYRNAVGAALALFYQPADFIRLTAEAYPGFHSDILADTRIITGLYLITSGHQFHLFFNNSADISPRTLPFRNGTSDGLHFGFIIKRNLHLDLLSKEKEDDHER